MKRLIACGVLSTVVLVSCGEGRDVTSPQERRSRWGWDKPLGTVGQPPPEMNCTPSTVSFGGTVTCTSNLQPSTNPSWNFWGNVQRPGPSAGGWSGPMVTSGTVTVDFTASDGSQQQLSAEVTVSRRNWSWSSSVSGHRGGHGEIDSCMGPTLALTTSVDCTVSTTTELFSPVTWQVSNGYSSVNVFGEGPNGGFWYVGQKSARMDLREQVNQKFRDDGPPWPVTSNGTVQNGCFAAFGNLDGRNIYTVNTVCVPTPAFSNMVNCLWPHEDQHVSIAVSAAQNSENDVYLLWEPLVATSSGGLYNAVSAEYSGASGRVYDASSALDNQVPHHPYDIWYNDANGWFILHLSVGC